GCDCAGSHRDFLGGIPFLEGCPAPERCWLRWPGTYRVRRGPREPLVAVVWCARRRVRTIVLRLDFNQRTALCSARLWEIALVQYLARHVFAGCGGSRGMVLLAASDRARQILLVLHWRSPLWPDHRRPGLVGSFPSAAQPDQLLAILCSSIGSDF